MIPLGDVPILIDGARVMLPVYSRAAVRGLRRVALRRAVVRDTAGQPATREIPTQYRRDTDAIPTAVFEPGRSS
jgi:hypothetical protein